MKMMFKTPRTLLISFFAVFLLATGAGGILAQPASAAPGGGGTSKSKKKQNNNGSTAPDSKCNAHILAIPAWYNGIVGRDGNGACGAIVSPSYFGSNGIQTFLIKVALNFLSILLFLAGYVCVGYIIFGGFKYFFSSGSTDGMSKAKSTILNAIIGLVISMASIGIVNAVAHVV